MKTGTIFLVTNFPQQWPVQEPTLIAKQLIDENSIFEILANVNGTLTFNVCGINLTTQIIAFKNAHRALVSCIWNDEKQIPIEVNFNSIRINEFNDQQFIIDSKPELTKDSSEIPIKEIKKTCLPWMEWRKHRYSSMKTEPKEGRVLKSLDIQVQELEEAIESLKHLQNTFSQKHNLYLQNVLPILRSLLFWPDSKGRGSRYNPLLLRITGYLKLPLPIFAFKDRIKDLKNNQLFKEAKSIKTFNFPSTIIKHDNEKLMDFQEWLDMEVIIDNSTNKLSTYRWKDIIFDGANASSSAHFDDDLPKFIDELKNNFSWEKSMFFEYVQSVVLITIELGEKIILAANTK
jgi:hypothetical protein